MKLVKRNYHGHISRTIKRFPLFLNLVIIIFLPTEQSVGSFIAEKRGCSRGGVSARSASAPAPPPPDFPRSSGPLCSERWQFLGSSSVSGAAASSVVSCAALGKRVMSPRSFFYDVKNHRWSMVGSVRLLQMNDTQFNYFLFAYCLDYFSKNNFLSFTTEFLGSRVCIGKAE